MKEMDVYNKNRQMEKRCVKETIYKQSCIIITLTHTPS